MKEKKQQKRKKKKGWDPLSLTVLLIALCVFVFSAYQLAMMMVPYYTGGEEYDEIKNLAIVSDKIGEGVEEAPKFQVDFDKLVQENPDTVAWLRFDQPSIISYPVVKSADNNEYLTKTFSANDNKLGAIFMDMRNQNDFSDRNTFIYGHNMKVGGEMFSQLNEYASEDFYKAHPYFYIYTPDGKTRTYEVFSAGVVKDSAEVYNLNITTDEEFEAYLAECKSTSNYVPDGKTRTYEVFSAGVVKDSAEVYNLNITTDEEFEAYLAECKSTSNYVTSPGVDRNSKIVSLSTCTNVNEDERFLLQGVLIKEE